MGYLQVVIFTFYSSLNIICQSAQTTCEQSEKLFADLCFTPTPTIDLDPILFMSLQPSDGWHIEFGNDVARLHVAEVLQGKLLKKEDIITDDFCPRIKIEHGDDSYHNDGEYFGFGNLSANFTCEGSKDYPGVILCKFENSRGTGYSERKNTYISYSNKKGLYVIIGCFETGEVGWFSASVSNKLTPEDKKIIESHVESLGFPAGTNVCLYTDSCL